MILIPLKGAYFILFKSNDLSASLFNYNEGFFKIILLPSLTADYPYYPKPLILI